MELRIPEDLSVVGFDDTPSAPITSPGLTTVRQDLEGLGSAAVDLLLYALSRETPAESGDPTVFPVSFVERQSTAKPLKGERG
jgi:LacI family transcriptional regulator